MFRTGKVAEVALGGGAAHPRAFGYLGRRQVFAGLAEQLLHRFQGV